MGVRSLVTPGAPANKMMMVYILSRRADQGCPVRMYRHGSKAVLTIFKTRINFSFLTHDITPPLLCTLLALLPAKSGKEDEAQTALAILHSDGDS